MTKRILFPDLKSFDLKFIANTLKTIYTTRGSLLKGAEGECPVARFFWGPVWAAEFSYNIEV